MQNPSDKYYWSFLGEDVPAGKGTKEYTASVENRRNHYLPRAGYCPLRRMHCRIKGFCDSEWLRRTMRSTLFHSFHRFPSFPPAGSYTLSLFLYLRTLGPTLRANRFDSCLPNESTFPPNRQNKSRPPPPRLYNVDDFVTMRVCPASTYARINT